MSEKPAGFNAIEGFRPMDWRDVAGRLSPDRPVLIAGPTASGKSALAMAIAETGGGRIINADALQVFEDWRILTARPSPQDEARVPHALYGFVPGDVAYSVGHWLRAVAPLLGGPRPIIVGGTGLYFTALTEGLAEIPDVPAEISEAAGRKLETEGLAAMAAELDAETAARIDLRNPRRVQRAWEVLAATGRGIAEWQDETRPPLLRLEDTSALVLDAPPDWLNPRIEARFDAMLEAGLLDEARANREGWHPGLPSAKAIGAAEVMAHLDGAMDLPDLRNNVAVKTRQYAKRQRSWFRGRMRQWRWIDPPTP